MRLGRSFMLVTSLLILATACGEGRAPEGPQIVYLSGLEQDTFTPSLVPDPGPSASADEIAKFATLLDSFEQGAPRLFAREDLVDRLDAIESAYLASGRYLDLVAIYRREVDAQGVTNIAAPRLAWAYLRLGQERDARELIFKLLEHAPDRAMSWFLLGAHWMRRAAESQEDAARVLVSWREALRLDPNFVGFERLNAAALRAETARIAQRVTMPEEELSALLQSMHPTPAVVVDEAATEQQPDAVVDPDADPASAPADPTPAAPDAAVAQAPTEVVPVPTPAPTPPPTPQAEPLPVLIARVQLALSQRDQTSAARQMELLARAHLQPTLAAGVAAMPPKHALATLQLDWELTADRNATAAAFRTFAKRADLPAPVRLDAARFAHRALEDTPLASELLRPLVARPDASPEARALDAMLKP